MQLERKSLASIIHQVKYTAHPTLYLDSKIEWRTSPFLDMIYIILKQKLHKEFTVATQL